MTTERANDMDICISVPELLQAAEVIADAIKGLAEATFYGVLCAAFLNGLMR